MSSDFENTANHLSILGLDFFPRQWKAVTAPIGPVLVLAGPGAGKTRCLAGRIAHLIQREGAEPSRICAITFTNKAAQEIAARARHGFGHVAEHLTLGTIHALCLKILRPFAKQMGLAPGFGVADDEQQRLILRRLHVHKTGQGSLLTRFGRRQHQGYNLTTREEKLFQDYQTELRGNRLIDYDDILVLTRQLLEQDPAVLFDTQNHWDHVLVDEFQDLDFTQYAILKLLASRHRSIFAVGDDEQSIFSWRGAEPSIIGHFMRDFGVLVAIQLNVNCRCSKTIFDTARRVLRQGELYARREITARHESPYPVEVIGHDDETAEAKWLVEHIRADLNESGISRGEYAILYRTHEIGARLEEALIAAGIPCQLGKGRAISDDPVVAQLASSLWLVLDEDCELEIERLARYSLSEALLAELATQPGSSLRDKLRRHAQGENGPDGRKCWRLLYQIDNLKSLRQVHGNLSNLINAILSLGIGAYESPLDQIADSLVDPISIPAACEMGRNLAEVAARNGRVLIPAKDGLELPMKHLLKKVFPSLQVEYLKDATNQDSRDLVLALPTTSAEPQDPDAIGGNTPRSATLEIFKALQVAASSQFRKVFTDYVAFDTETTDKDVDACEVVELAAVRVRDGKIVDQFQTLVRCSRPVAPGATAIHGYVGADLADQPTLEEVWPSFRAFIGDSVLVAHNGHKFDVPVLKRLTLSWDGLAGVNFFDSLPLARQLFPKGGLRLADLAERFGVDAGRSHHALDDTICLAQVFERLQDERLRRIRVSCLANLIDWLAVGLALEGPLSGADELEVIYRKGSRRALSKFSTVLYDYEQEAAANGIVCPPVAEIIDRLGGRDLQQQIRQETAPQDRYPETYARLQQLIASAASDTLEGAVRCFLDRLALSRSDGAGIDPDRVCLLTFHATKGLEFSRVYVVGVEDNQLPGFHAMQENRENDIHEARRLLYVAMTRAKDRLCLTHCRQRNGRPTGGTLFLSDMGLIETAKSATILN